MIITVVGTGYVGLVSGVCFAELGHTVVCVDKDADKLAALRSGHSPIYEPGLEELMVRNVERGRLSFTDDLSAAMTGADAVFIAVGTPTRRGDGHADMRYVFAAAEEIATTMDHPMVVVTKSTVPVGTNRMLSALMSRANPNAAFELASNPEFLREGAAISDFMSPDRVVIGTDSPRAKAVMRDIYKPQEDQGHLIFHTDLQSAEMIKYAANAFLAIKVAFINEVSGLCDRMQADVGDVAHGIGLDTRVGPRFLQPGPGIGGSCFPKDTRAFARTGQEHGFPLKIVEAAIDSNERHKLRMIDKLKDLLDGQFVGRRVAVFGATFKPDTDDMREAPSLTIVPALLGNGASVTIVDPQGAKDGQRLFPGAHWSDDPYVAAAGADAVVVLTEWDQFRWLDLTRLASGMNSARIADFRNIYDPADLRKAGFEAVETVGRGRIAPDATEAAEIQFAEYMKKPAQ